MLSFFFCRNEKNQLFLGIRRANRSQTVMPSSVLSSDSMHLGLLAAAAHAAATNSRFTIFYNPRFVPLQNDQPIRLLLTQQLYSNFWLACIDIGLVLQTLLYLLPSMSKQCIILAFLQACASECYLKLKNLVFVGRLSHLFYLWFIFLFLVLARMP